MTRALGIGLQTNKPLETYGTLAHAAETAGFESVTVFNDLFFQPALPALLAIAAATSRIRLGPSCLNPYTSHPVEIAGQIAMLDAAAGGRAYLGLAAGAWLGEVGIAQPRPLVAVRETWEVVRRLLSGDDAGFEGEMHRLSPGKRLRYPVYRPSVPLLVGAWRPRMLALAGEIADEVKLGGTANPDLVAWAREQIAEGARAAGRGGATVDVVIGSTTVVDEDDGRARAYARTRLALHLEVVGGLDPTFAVDPELLGRLRERLDAGDDRGAGKLIPDDVLDRFSFAGTPRRIAEQCERAFAAGVRRIEFGSPHGIDEQRGIELLIRDVAPLLRDAAAA